MITAKELRTLLEEEKVRNYRLNGFLFSHAIDSSKYTGLNYAILKGKIPLSLARKISNGIDNSELQIRIHGLSASQKPDDIATNADLEEMWFDLQKEKHDYVTAFEKAKRIYIQKAENEGHLDDIYLLYYHIYTLQGLRHVINCIRESKVKNQCVFY